MSTDPKSKQRSYAPVHADVSWKERAKPTTTIEAMASEPSLGRTCRIGVSGIRGSYIADWIERTFARLPA
jgi:hypothetical protein